MIDALARLVRFVIAAVTCGAGCGVPLGTATAPHSDFVAASLSVPGGATLEQACTPSGPELCFNAIDDNCNGVIDEGCGEATGLLQFTIAWGPVPADVNLTVITPKEDRVPSAKARSAGGFQAGDDCPGPEGCRGQNFENVWFDGAEPPRGRYGVEISLGNLQGAEPPVKVRFGARLGARTVGFEVNLAPGDAAKQIFGFELP